MKLNKPEFKKLLYEQFDGNFTKLAKALGLDTAYVYRIIEKEKNCGLKFFSSLMRWCKENNKNFEDYIFLP